MVEAYEKTLEGSDEPQKEPYEYSEMLLYKNQLYEESGQQQPEWAGCHNHFANGFGASGVGASGVGAPPSAAAAVGTSL